MTHHVKTAATTEEVSLPPVCTQIWIAIATYLIVAIKKKELGVEASLYEILQKISVSLFEKATIYELLTKEHSPITDVVRSNQLLFNDYDRTLLSLNRCEKR